MDVALVAILLPTPLFFRQCDHQVTTGGGESHTLSVPNKKGDHNEKSCFSLASVWAP
jgi:hypothetical protein